MEPVPFIDDVIKNAGAMAPIAVAFWFMFKHYVREAEADRQELRESRREMISVVKDNTQALTALRDSLNHTCRFGRGDNEV